MKYLLKPCMHNKMQMRNHKDIGPSVLVVAKVRLRVMGRISPRHTVIQNQQSCPEIQLLKYFLKRFSLTNLAV